MSASTPLHDALNAPFKASKAERKAYRKLSKALAIIARYGCHIPYESRIQFDDALTEWLGGFAWQDDPKIVRRIGPRVMRLERKERWEEELREPQEVEVDPAA